MKPKGVRERHSTPEFETIAADGLILKTQVGSGLHGIAVGDQDDRDEMGICVEPPWHVIGPGTFEQYIGRTAPERASHDDMCKRTDEHPAETCPAVEYARSGPGDLDLTVYSLRKWMRLALNGHPTILLPLFAPDAEVVVTTPAGRQLRDMAPLIVSRQCGERFIGYLRKQREQLERHDRGEKSNRPELIARYGFDVKYAAHMIRIGVQGAELLDTGRISLPMYEPWRGWLTGLRQGRVDKKEALDTARRCEESLITAMSCSPLPERPDDRQCWAWTIRAYQEAWACPAPEEGQ